MSVLTVFTKTAPKLAGVEFDAVLEDTLTLEVEYTKYPIESGAMVRDHGIVQPFKYSMVGAVSNNPIKPTLGGLATGVLSNLSDSGIISGIAGLSAGLLSGSDETRASNALDFLIQLTQLREPFDVDAGDITLKNMVISKISRTKNPENENALIFIADLVELPTLDTVISQSLNPSQQQLRDGDPAKSQAASNVDRGMVSPSLNAGVLPL